MSGQEQIIFATMVSGSTIAIMGGMKLVHFLKNDTRLMWQLRFVKEVASYAILALFAHGVK